MSLKVKIALYSQNANRYRNLTVSSPMNTARFCRLDNFMEEDFISADVVFKDPKSFNLS